MNKRLRSVFLVSAVTVALAIGTGTPANALSRTVSTSQGRCALFVQKSPAHSSVFKDTCSPVQASVTYRTSAGYLSTAYGRTDPWESLVNGATSMVIERGAGGAYKGSRLSWINF